MDIIPIARIFKEGFNIYIALHVYLHWVHIVDQYSHLDINTHHQCFYIIHHVNSYKYKIYIDHSYQYNVTCIGAFMIVIVW